MSTSIYVVMHRKFNKKMLYLHDCYNVIAVGNKSNEIQEQEIVLTQI